MIHDSNSPLGLQRNNENGNLWNNLTYNYNSTSNRLQSVSDAAGNLSATFTYDANGNMVSQSGKFSDINYEHRNLPTWFHTISAPDVRAYYNPSGKRILKEVTNGKWQFYVRDGELTLAVFNQNGFSHFNLVGNSIFGRFEPPTGSRRYYIKDHLGSTRVVKNSSGTVLSTYDYYPFGLLMEGRYSVNNNTIEKFTGKERDDAIGLDYFGARYYDPALARWHSPDPLAQKHPEWSTYNYALNNPLYYIDPDGRQIAAPLFNMRQGFKNAMVGAAKGAWYMVSNLGDAVTGIRYAVSLPAQTLSHNIYYVK